MCQPNHDQFMTIMKCSSIDLWGDKTQVLRLNIEVEKMENENLITIFICVGSATRNFRQGKSKGESCFGYVVVQGRALSLI